MLLHANVLAQVGGHIEVLTFDDRGLAFLKSPARDRFKLHNFLTRLHEFFLAHNRLFRGRFFFFLPNRRRRRCCYLLLFMRWMLLRLKIGG